jgi:hypothetical protein
LMFQLRYFSFDSRFFSAGHPRLLIYRNLRRLLRTSPLNPLSIVERGLPYR